MPKGYWIGHITVIEFDSYEKALSCYYSPECRAAAKLRQAYAKSNILVVEGVREA